MFGIGSNGVDMNPNNDIKLLYTGGSGGFIVLHYLLLTKKYQINIVNSVFTIEKIIEKQWAIKNSTLWKNHEIAPSNPLTKLLPSPRLYFFCNPTDTADYHGDHLVVYTDLASQIKLAQYKNANWFTPNTFYSQARRLLLTWRIHYQSIKDPSWPDCSSWRKVNRLPEYIKNEIISNEHHLFFVGQESKLKSVNLVASPISKPALPQGVVYNDIKVTVNTHHLIATAKHAIKLQDFINSQGQNLLDQLGLGTATKEQILLLERWKKLHSPDLLKQIGINP